MRYIDPLTDTRSDFLYQKIDKRLTPDFVEELTKEAAATPPEGFADPVNRCFPIFNEKAAAASSVYAEHQDVPEGIKDQIKQAMDLFNVEVDVPEEKVASAPDDDDFLFPEQRRVLVASEDQVKTAEVLLKVHRETMPIITRTYAYRRLREKSASFGVDLDADSLQYCGDTRCHVPTLCENIYRRREHTLDPNVKQAFITLETQLRELGIEHIDDASENDKLAHLLLDLDEEAGIQKRYGRPGKLGFPDPIMSVFNTDKTASDFIQMGGQEIPLDAIRGLDPEMIGDMVGEEFMEDIVDGNGDIDPQEFQQTLSILPADLQEEIVQRFNL